MPKSKGRKKQQERRYQLGSSARTKRKTSPRWYGPLLIVLMSLGVLIIVLNYVGLIPGTDNLASPVWLWVGLGLIGAGFVGTTYWY
jgi:antibiotic biosynthesis monooxygenase (ABM) superfamily enzyme